MPEPDETSPIAERMIREVGAKQDRMLRARTRQERDLELDRDPGRGGLVGRRCRRCSASRWASGSTTAGRAASPGR